jgi:GPH family glycoside/pentoside/hexuronide:cation symporter
MLKSLSYKALLKYSQIAMPLAFVSTPLYLFTPDFYAVRHQVSLALLANLLVLLRTLDAFQDPLIGYLSDKYSDQRPKIMLLAACILSPSFYFLFHPLLTPLWLNFAVFIFLATTGYSAMSINLNALGALWGQNDIERFQVVGYREAFGLLGLIVAVVLPAIDVGFAHQFTLSSWVFIVLIGCSLGFFNRWYAQTSLSALHPDAKTTASWRDFMRLPKPVYLVYLVYAVSMLASSLAGVLVVFFIRDFLGLQAYTGWFLSCYFVCAVLSMPLWKYGFRAVGLVWGWLIGLLSAIVFFVGAYWLEPNEMLGYSLICIGSGLALGAEILVPPMWLAETIQKHQREQQAAMIFGGLAFLNKLSLAGAGVIAFHFLDHFEFVPGQANQSRALWALCLMYAIVPCVLKACAAVLLLVIERPHLATDAASST